MINYYYFLIKNSNIHLFQAALIFYYLDQSLNLVASFRSNEKNKNKNQFYDAKIVAIGDQNFVNSQKERLEEKFQEMNVHGLSFLNKKENRQLPDKQV